MKNQKKPEATEKKTPLEPPSANDKPALRPPQNGNPKHPSKNPQNGKPPSVLPHSPSASKLNSHQRRLRAEEGAGESSKSQSNVSRGRASESLLMVDRVVQLHERLKNIHHFYKTRIEDEKSRVNQRNEVFMGIVEEMQRAHNEKASALRKMVE